LPRYGKSPEKTSAQPDALRASWCTLTDPPALVHAPHLGGVSDTAAQASKRGPSAPRAHRHCRGQGRFLRHGLSREAALGTDFSPHPSIREAIRQLCRARFVSSGTVCREAVSPNFPSHLLELCSNRYKIFVIFYR
jgi:hypothetical protein